MKKYLILLASAAALTSFAPATSSAQGIGIDLPGVGVRVGDPYHRHHYRDWDGPRVYHRDGWRERNVYLRGGSDCRTVTIHRDDGVVKRIRRCD